jgi:hypothetical protein
MNSSHIIDCLRNPHPAGQDGDIGDEANVSHQKVALSPGITAEHFEIALIWNQAEDCIQCRGLAGTVRSDEAEYAAFFDAQINAV